MSNLNTFVDKVKTLIDGNAELKNSVILNKVLESVRYTGDDVQFLTDLKESIDDVNKFLSNSELKNISESIDMKLSEYSNTDSAVLQKISGGQHNCAEFQRKINILINPSAFPRD